MSTRITAHIQGLGYFDAPPELVDRAIAEFLPASPAQLQAIVEDRTGDMYQGLSVTESLVMLASFYPDNPH